MIDIENAARGIRCNLAGRQLATHQITDWASVSLSKWGKVCTFLCTQVEVAIVAIGKDPHCCQYRCRWRTILTHFYHWYRIIMIALWVLSKFLTFLLPASCFVLFFCNLEEEYGRRGGENFALKEPVFLASSWYSLAEDAFYLERGCCHVDCLSPRWILP